MANKAEEEVKRLKKARARLTFSDLPHDHIALMNTPLRLVPFAAIWNHFSHSNMKLDMDAVI